MEAANGPLRIGDRIPYELPVDFTEEDITSLEVATHRSKRHVLALRQESRPAWFTNFRKHKALYLVKFHRNKIEAGGSP